MKQCFPLTPAAGPNKQGEYAYNTWEGEIKGRMPPSQQTPPLSITVAQGSYPIPSDCVAPLPTPAPSAIHPTEAPSVCIRYSVDTTDRAQKTNIHCTACHNSTKHSCTVLDFSLVVNYEHRVFENRVPWLWTRLQVIWRNIMSGNIIYPLQQMILRWSNEGM
jgi:hypothetical protein